MKMISCPNCGQPISFLGHQCPYCRIRIVGASGLSKLMRQIGNSPVMLASGFFIVAFLVCIAILWKLGMVKSQPAEKVTSGAAQKTSSHIGSSGSAPASQNESSKFSGTWSGKYIDTLGDSDDAELTM